MVASVLSVNEVKKGAFLKRFFKIKKNRVFLFGLSFFFLEIMTFLYYANEENDDVLNCSTKTLQY